MSPRVSNFMLQWFWIFMKEINFEKFYFELDHKLSFEKFIIFSLSFECAGSATVSFLTQ